MNIVEHYLKQAKFLLSQIENYKDEHSKELKNVLVKFISEPNGDLSDLICNIEMSKKETYYTLYNLDINISISEIFYPNEDVLVL